MLQSGGMRKGRKENKYNCGIGDCCGQAYPQRCQFSWFRGTLGFIKKFVCNKTKFLLNP